MRPSKEETCQRMAGRLLQSLESDGGARFKAGLAQLRDCVAQTLLREEGKVEELDRAARALLDEHLRTAPPGIDRQKLLQMIRKKLAQEKGVPL